MLGILRGRLKKEMVVPRIKWKLIWNNGVIISRNVFSLGKPNWKIEIKRRGGSTRGDGVKCTPAGGTSASLRHKGTPPPPWCMSPPGFEPGISSV
jgi:hypothetical protein